MICARDGTVVSGAKMSGENPGVDDRYIFRLKCKEKTATAIV